MQLEIRADILHPPLTNFYFRLTLKPFSVWKVTMGAIAELQVDAFSTNTGNVSKSPSGFDDFLELPILVLQYCNIARADELQVDAFSTNTLNDLYLLKRTLPKSRSLRGGPVGAGRTRAGKIPASGRVRLRQRLGHSSTAEGAARWLS